MARTSKRRRERGTASVNRGTRRKWIRGAILAAGIATGIAAWQWPGVLWGYKNARSFTLQSSTGRAFSLEDFRGKKEIVLVFYMGAG